MTQYDYFIDEFGLFDGFFFNMSPRKVQIVNSQMRLAFVTAYETLKRANYVDNRTAAIQMQRIDIYYNQIADDYREVNQGQKINTYYISNDYRAFGPDRINYFFKFADLSYNIDIICFSGFAAIEIRARSCRILENKKR